MVVCVRNEREIKGFVQEAASKFENIQIEDFVRVSTLGKGGFGKVELVVLKNNPKETFALKCLKKTLVVNRKYQSQVLNEKNVHITCDCLFITKLYKTFHDNKYVYFLLEPCLGADLYSMIRRQPEGYLNEIQARFYAACTLEALTYLHDRDIIYRDLKPENLMVSNQGYVKLTDMGLVKKVNANERTFSFSGTAEYLAPEVIEHIGYNKEVDYWAFGVLIHEMLSGKTPFRSREQTQSQLYASIMRGIEKVTFPKHLSEIVRNLVRKLCRRNPNDRLRNEDIRKHWWFRVINWNSLKQQNIKAPFLPVLRNNLDTFYFPEIKEDYDVPEDELSGWDKDF